LELTSKLEAIATDLRLGCSLFLPYQGMNPSEGTAEPASSVTVAKCLFRGLSDDSPASAFCSGGEHGVTGFVTNISTRLSDKWAEILKLFRGSQMSACLDDFDELIMIARFSDFKNLLVAGLDLSGEFQNPLCQ
jgi:hypothetical protein